MKKKPIDNPLLKLAIANLQSAVKTLMELAADPDETNINCYGPSNAIINVKLRFERVFDVKRLANELGLDEAIRP